MSRWQTLSSALAMDLPTVEDLHTARQLRRLDLALALLLSALLAAPMALGLMVGRLSVKRYQGLHGQGFLRWQLVLPNHWMGRLMAKTGMQGWPVLWNILRGEMAWVGPKPVALSTHRTAEQMSVRPGLVNLWDLRQRTAVDFGSEADAEREYLGLRGVRHDMGLLLRASLVLWLPASRKAQPGRVAVGDVAFDNISMQQAVDQILLMLDGAAARQVSFVNPACVNIAAGDRGYRRLLSRAAMVLPDGIGIKIAADILGAPLKQNVNGTDLFPRLCQRLEQRQASVFLLGGHPGVAERVAAVMKAQWPALRVVGVRDGFFAVAEEGQVAAQVKASGADVVLVARGVPMQDVFIDRHLHQLGVKVAIGVGGLFDFVSGRIRRAPTWMRDSGLEWIYRLLQEPSRMWQRYLVGNFTFLGRVVLQRLGLRTAANDSISDELSSVASTVSTVAQLRSVLFLTAPAPADVPVPTDYPAALLPYGHSSLVEHTLDQLSQAGVRELDLVVSTRPEDFRQLLGQGERWGMTLRWHLAKDASTPYGVLKSLGLIEHQRVLIGHADRLIADLALSTLIESDQIAAFPHEQQGITWSGWGSTTAGVLQGQAPHCDASALGAYLQAQAEHVLVLDPDECTAILSAHDLLQAQQRTLRETALAQVPATWLATSWGAHSPDAVIQPGALMEGPALIGPGCLITSGARIGAGTVLARNVVVCAGTCVTHSLVLPNTLVGASLELDQTIVNGTSVQHLRLGVRTVLPTSEGLLLNLKQPGGRAISWMSRGVAALACLLLLPIVLVDGALRRLHKLPLRWEKRQVVMGRHADTQAVQLQTLRCANPVHSGLGKLIAHYGEWLDVLAGLRSWFGARPRSASEWYALSQDWQMLLSDAPVGCVHTTAWFDPDENSLQALAAADVYFAVHSNLTQKMRVIGALLMVWVSQIGASRSKKLRK